MTHFACLLLFGGKNTARVIFIDLRINYCGSINKPASVIADVLVDSIKFRLT
jgi:hypothetical protein